MWFRKINNCSDRGRIRPIPRIPSEFITWPKMVTSEQPKQHVFELKKTILPGKCISKGDNITKDFPMVTSWQIIISAMRNLAISSVVPCEVAPVSAYLVCWSTQAMIQRFPLVEYRNGLNRSMPNLRKSIDDGRIYFKVPFWFWQSSNARKPVVTTRRIPDQKKTTIKNSAKCSYET